MTTGQGISRQSRFRGALLGLAAGDALGTTVEFCAPGSFTRLTDMVGGGPFGLAPGQWTDDTSMALCLGESLLACKGFDPKDQLERYVRWWREGHWSSTGRCFDIGNTVAAALQRFERTSEDYCGSTDPRSAGNGSLMRLVPVVLFYANAPADAIRFAADSSRTTHAAVEAVDACRYYAALILRALDGASREEIVGARPESLSGERLAPALESIAEGSFKHKDPPEIRGKGYVVPALEAALWALDRSTSFEEGCLLAANLGDDADTTAAIYGQLAGAIYGETGIPERWREKLTFVDRITAMADALYEAAEARAQR